MKYRIEYVEADIVELHPIKEKKCYHHVVDGKCVKCGFTGVEQPAPWPQEGDEYWVAESDGSIDRDYYNGNLDKDIFSMGNGFKVKEEAEDYARRQKAIVRVNNRIEELNDGWEPEFVDFEDKHLIVRCGGLDSKNTYGVADYPSELLYCKNIYTANQIISEMEGDLKLIFNIESN